MPAGTGGYVLAGTGGYVPNHQHGVMRAVAREPEGSSVQVTLVPCQVDKVDDLAALGANIFVVVISAACAGPVHDVALQYGGRGIEDNILHSGNRIT